MTRETGTYRTMVYGDEKVRAFVPRALPPKDPPLRFEGEIADLHARASAAMGRLAIAGTMVPSPNWFLYGFVRKEAVVSSQIEGTQATLEDVAAYEASPRTEQTADVLEVCNYVDAISLVRAEIKRQDGLPPLHAIALQGPRTASPRRSRG